MKIKTIEMIIALAAFFAFVAYIRPIGTGFLVEANSHTQNLNIILNSSESFMLRSLTNEPVKIDSFSLSGKVAGDGVVAVYLNDLLVYTNAKKMSGFNLITGFPIATTNAPASSASSGKALFSIESTGATDFNDAIKSAAGYTTGSFADTCIESCSLPPTAESPNYTMKVYVESGTTFTLGRILYITG